MRVRAKTKGFNAGARRVAGEVFETLGKQVPKNCERVSDDTPIGRPGREQEAAPNFVKKGGQYVNADQRTSADAFKASGGGPVQGDTSYLDRFADAQPQASGEDSLTD